MSVVSGCRCTAAGLAWGTKGTPGSVWGFAKRVMAVVSGIWFGG